MLGVHQALVAATAAVVAAAAVATACVVAMPAAASAAATPSGAPVGVKAVAGASKVRLTWQPPPPDASPDGSVSASPAPSGPGYFVYAGTRPGRESKAPVNATPVSGLSYVVKGLANGTTYYFTVATAGARATSAEVTATPATTPGAPAGLLVTPAHARVTLSWTAPASDGGSAVTGYRVYLGAMTDFTRGTLAGSVTGTRATVTGLTSGASYWFRVAAVNAAGQGTWSLPMLASVPPAVGPGTPASSSPASAPASPASASAPATVPPLAAPAGLTAALGDAEVLVSWTAPASDGGTPVTSYRLYLATRPGSQAGAQVTSITGTSAMVAGLTNGVTYYFTVAAVDAAGRQGPLSAELSARPGPATMMNLTSGHVPDQRIAWLAALSVTAMAGALAVAVVGRRRDARVAGR
jgi:chitodextrinase